MEDKYNQLVEKITTEVMRRLAAKEPSPRILVLGKQPDCRIAKCLQKEMTAEIRPNLEAMQAYDFVVLPVGYLQKQLQKKTEQPTSAPAKASCSSKQIVDWTAKKLIHERELTDQKITTHACLHIGKQTIVTQLAAEYLQKHKIEVVKTAHH